MNPIEALKMHGVGVGKKLVGDAQSTDVRAGKTFSNAQGNDKVGTVPVRSLVAQTITPGVNNIIKQAGIYDGDITIEGDPDLVGQNILQGKIVFGVEGSFNGKRYATGDVASAASSRLYYDLKAANSSSRYPIVVTGLNFEPSVIVILRRIAARKDYYTGFFFYNKDATTTAALRYFPMTLVGTDYWYEVTSVTSSTKAYVTNGAFDLPHPDANVPLTWYAYE